MKKILLFLSVAVSIYFTNAALADNTSFEKLRQHFVNEPEFETQLKVALAIEEDPSLAKRHEDIGDLYAAWIPKATHPDAKKEIRAQALYHYNAAYSAAPKNQTLIAKMESVSMPITTHTLRAFRLSQEGQTGSGIDFNINFAANAYTIPPRSYKVLNTLADYLAANKNVKISLEGHTDNTGTKEYNQALSEKRAEHTKAYLVSRSKIDPDRIKTCGWGNTRPKDKEHDISWINRRVEMIKLTQ